MSQCTSHVTGGLLLDGKLLPVTERVFLLRQDVSCVGGSLPMAGKFFVLFLFLTRGNRSSCTQFLSEEALNLSHWILKVEQKNHKPLWRF